MFGVPVVDGRVAPAADEGVAAQVVAAAAVQGATAATLVEVWKMYNT